ncbi:MAG: hypothetical protein J2P24_00390 [Streptosporangiales bacterium]|nr:hypothetical protein [Streptosporangiales bacterium]
MHPVTVEGKLLVEIRDLLRDVRDRLPEQQPPTEPAAGEPVEVRGADRPAAPPARKTASKKTAARARKKQ